MARLPRLVLPGYPYHVTQRGNRRQQTFFQDGDYELYRDLLAEAADKADAAIWCNSSTTAHPISRISEWRRLVSSILPISSCLIRAMPSRSWVQDSRKAVRSSQVRLSYAS